MGLLPVVRWLSSTVGPVNVAGTLMAIPSLSIALRASFDVMLRKSAPVKVVVGVY